MESEFWQLNDPAWLREHYLERGHTGQELAAQIGCSTTAVVRHLHRHGIRKHHDLDEAWIRRRYIDEGATVTTIAEELGVRDMVVARALRRFRITPLRIRPRIDALHDTAWLREQIDQGRTHQQIADELDCSRSAVSMAVKRRLS